MKIVLAGGTGFIGSAVKLRLLRDGHHVVLLTRRPERVRPPAGESIEVEGWDGRSGGPWQRCVSGADAVINYTGESVIAGRWSPRRKAELLNSRLQPTRALVEAIAQADRKPALMISASATGYYGDVRGGRVTESHPSGGGFLAYVCRGWEDEARRVEAHGVRLMISRTGPVIGRDDEFLSRMLPVFRAFLGGVVGSGDQWIPWIHREDVAGIVAFALDHADISGPVNVTAPEPVTMRRFAHTLGEVLDRPVWTRVPSPAVRVAMGEMAEAVLAGQAAVPEKLAAAGYQFRYPTLREALAAVLKA